MAICGVSYQDSMQSCRLHGQWASTAREGMPPYTPESVLMKGVAGVLTQRQCVRAELVTPADYHRS